MEWIANDSGTMVVALILIGMVCAIIRGLIRDKKEGRASCGCNCAHCAMSGACHKNKGEGA